MSKAKKDWWRGTGAVTPVTNYACGRVLYEYLAWLTREIERRRRAEENASADALNLARSQLERLINLQPLAVQHLTVLAVAEEKKAAIQTQRSLEDDSVKASWVATALKYADEIYRRDKRQGLEPSKNDISTEIAKKFDREGVRGERGTLNPTTILRHALNNWKKPS